MGLSPASDGPKATRPGKQCVDRAGGRPRRETQRERLRAQPGPVLPTLLAIRGSYFRSYTKSGACASWRSIVSRVSTSRSTSDRIAAYAWPAIDPLRTIKSMKSSRYHGGLAFCAAQTSEVLEIGRAAHAVDGAPQHDGRRRLVDAGLHPVWRQPIAEDLGRHLDRPQDSEGEPEAVDHIGRVPLLERGYKRDPAGRYRQPSPSIGHDVFPRRSRDILRPKRTPITLITNSTARTSKSWTIVLQPRDS
jgi:hypothetical protein